MSPLKSNEEVKSESEKTIAERISLKPQKIIKITGKGVKILTPNK